MAAPMVAGAVALLMECNPNLSLSQLHQALRLSAVYDNFVLQQVFALPNIHWGYGKLDVYNLLQECLIFGCMDSTAINFNPLANVSDSSCYYVTSTESIEIVNDIEIYPNPFNYSFVVTLSGVISETRVFDKAGKEVYLNLDVYDNHIEINGQEWARGVYVVKVKDESGNQYIQKLVK